MATDPASNGRPAGSSARQQLGDKAAARAAETPTDAQVRELSALHHELIPAAARDDRALLEEKNHAFHRQINVMAGAPKIAWVLHVLTRYVPHRFYAQIPGWPEATMADHGRLLAAIRDRDADRTRAEMHNHIVPAGELLAAHFEARAAEVR